MNTKHISHTGQIRIYTGKCFRVFKNERGWVSFISAVIITLFISLVTGDDMFVTYSATQNGTFALVSACIWIGIFNSIRSICRERNIIKREYRTGLYLSSYIFAHMIYEAVICFVESMIVTVTVYLFNISNWPDAGVVLPVIIELFITFWLIIYSSDVLGILVSSIVKNENTAMTVMPFILIIQLVMSGVIFELDGIPKLISAVTICRWGMGAVCSTVNINELSLPPMLNRIADYESTFENLLSLWGLLVLFIAVYGLLSIISLRFVDKDKR